MILFPPPGFDPQQLRAELEAAGYVIVSATVREDEVEVEFEGEPSSVDIEAIVAAHVPDDRRQLDQLVAKARRVWRGEDTFTVAQIQKIVAGLVLLENRRR